MTQTVQGKVVERYWRGLNATVSVTHQGGLPGYVSVAIPKSLEDAVRKDSLVEISEAEVEGSKWPKREIIKVIEQNNAQTLEN